jgi:hypothetical protein
MPGHAQSLSGLRVPNVSPPVSQLLAVVQHSPYRHKQLALPHVASFVHRLLSPLASTVAASNRTDSLFRNANNPQGSLCDVAYSNH